MLDPRQFLRFVIRPTLAHLELGGKAAEVLLLGTALAESRMSKIDQVTGPNDATLGPAIGLYQMEPATHDDIWTNYLVYQPALRLLVEALLSPAPNRHLQLAGNLAYATAMVRVHYRRVSEALPDAADGEGMSRYHKRHYNTAAGKADPARNLQYFLQAYLIVDQTR